MTALIAALLLVGRWDYEDEIKVEKYYEESVCLWYATGGSDRTEGRFGHPDYKNLGVVCLHVGKYSQLRVTLTAIARVSIRSVDFVSVLKPWD
jgi:hypothetical protein